MKWLISLINILFFIILTIVITPAHAEFYVDRCEPVFTPCSPPPCKCRHRIHRHHKHHCVRHHISNCCGPWNCCDQDLATGDDNPCLHPDLQINY